MFFYSAIVLFLAIPLTQCQTVFRNPQAVTVLVSVGNKEYYLVVQPKANWTEAIQYCYKYNMQLASIETKAESDAVIMAINATGLESQMGINSQYNFWTSGYSVHNRQYYWTNTGAPFSIGYTLWQQGEPSFMRPSTGKAENCVQIWDRHAGKGLRWNDAECSLVCRFICQKKR